MCAGFIVVAATSVWLHAGFIVVAATSVWLHVGFVVVAVTSVWPYVRLCCGVVVAATSVCSCITFEIDLYTGMCVAVSAIFIQCHAQNNYVILIYIKIMTFAPT